MKKSKLIRDLRKTGATPHEAAELASIASQIENIQPRGLRRETKDRIARIPGKPSFYLHIPLRYAAGSAMAVMLVTFGIAQTANPGSLLYGIKRGTQEVRTWVNPDYVDTLVEEREKEVEQLKQENAAPEKIEQAELEAEQTKERSRQRQEKRQKENRGEEKDSDSNRNKNQKYWEDTRNKNLDNSNQNFKDWNRDSRQA